MIDIEKIAHDLSLLWVQGVLNGKVSPMTTDKGIIDEYVAAYQEAIEKLKKIDSKESPKDSM